MKEVLFVILDEYADWEAAPIAAALNDYAECKGYCVKTLSLTRQPVRSMGGFTALPDYDLDSAPCDFAALLLIGGRSWYKESAKQVLPLIKNAIARNAPVGAICGAATFLAMNALLNDIPHTGNSISALKERAGESYTGEKHFIPQQAVTGGNIITANGSAFLEFAKEVLQALRAMPQEKIDEWYDYLKLGHYEFMKKQKQ